MVERFPDKLQIRDSLKTDKKPDNITQREVLLICNKGFLQFLSNFFSLTAGCCCTVMVHLAELFHKENCL